MNSIVSSPVLVLVHAFPVGARMWVPQIDAFPGWRVLTPSLPGFDETPRVAQPSMRAYAERILASLGENGVQRAVFGGLSLGGYVTFALARLAQSRMAGLILADTRSGADSEAARSGRERMLALIERGGPAAVAEDMVPKLLGASTLASQPQVVAHVRSLIEAQSNDALADATRAMMTRDDSTPLLATLDVPALVVVGEEDTLTPPEQAEHMAAVLRRATLARIAAAGHLSSVENPDAFNAAVTVFLASL